jgi:2-dehydropantoate 2-reductase
VEFVIIGAGAIGGSLGAYLVRAGHDVLLVESARDHVQVMQAKGLHIEGRLDFTVPVRATLPDDLQAALGGRPAATVVLAVKAQHTETALQPVLAHLPADGCVVSMQNGLNPMAIAGIVGRARTLGACINSMGTDYQSPGRILYGGPGTIRLGELDGRITPRVTALVAVLRAAYVENTEATANIWGHLWSKEAYGAWLFATALTNETMADFMADPANCSMLANLAAEVIRVAEADCVRCEVLDGFVPDAIRFRMPRDWPGIRASLAAMAAMNRRSHKARSGIWRDIAIRGRRSEIDAQLGIVLERAAAHGIAVPLLDNLVAQVHALEHKARAMAPENLEALRRIDAQAYAAE